LVHSCLAGIILYYIRHLDEFLISIAHYNELYYTVRGQKR